MQQAILRDGLLLSPAESPMSTLPPCPQCASEFAYADGASYVCPECAHEWPQQAAPGALEPHLVRETNGNVLLDADSVPVIKFINLKG